MIITWGPYAHRVQQSVVHLEARRLSLTVLSPVLDEFGQRHPLPPISVQRIATWTEFEPYTRAAPTDIAHRSAVPDLSLAGTYVRDLPADDGDRAQTLFQVMGKITLDLDGPLGQDEWVDYSIFDFVCAADGTPLLVINRFAVTNDLKAGFSARMRGLYPGGASTYLTLCLPFAETDLRQIELIGVPWGRYKPLGFTPDEARIAFPPGAKLAYGLYEAVPPAGIDLTVPAGQTITIPLSLRWKHNTDYGHPEGTPVRRSTRFKVEASAGYLPRRVLRMNDNGEAMLDIAAFGLAPGDEIKIKLNATHFTGVGSFVVRVV